MKSLLFLFYLCLFINCTQSVKLHTAKWKEIEIGDYILEFPPDFTLVPIKGSDSYVGKIVRDSLEIKFDFGYYSPSFGQTPQDYLKGARWKFDAAFQVMKRHKRYNDSNFPKIEAVYVRPAVGEDSVLGKGCDYVAKCKYKNKEFDYAIFLPDEIKNYDFITDSTNEFYRKIVLAKNPRKGATGLYIREKKFSNDNNSYLSLSMFATNLTKQQQELVKKIYNTALLNKNKR